MNTVNSNITKVYNIMIWESPLSDGRKLYISSINKPFGDKKRTYFVRIERSGITGALPVCKLDDKGKVLTTYMNLTQEMCNLIESTNLQTSLAIEQIHDS